MDWGCTAALVVSALALVIGVKASADAKRSRTIAEKTPEVERPAAAEAAEVAEAGHAAEAKSAATEVAESAPAPVAEAKPEPEEPAQGGVELDVQHVENDLYRLRNNGNAPAMNIVFDEEHLPAVFLLRGAGDVNLEHDETIDFLMAGSVDKPLAQEILARWDGQQTPVPLAVPVKA